MCEHEDDDCPPGCECECMNCFDPQGDDPLYLSALYSDEMENPL